MNFRSLLVLAFAFAGLAASAPGGKDRIPICGLGLRSRRLFRLSCGAGLFLSLAGGFSRGLLGSAAHRLLSRQPFFQRLLGRLALGNAGVSGLHDSGARLQAFGPFRVFGDRLGALELRFSRFIGRRQAVLQID
jgi:hypothetical protein